MSLPPDRPSARPTGPPPKEDAAGEERARPERPTLVDESELADAVLRSKKKSGELEIPARETKPPTRLETMEVQAAWLQTQGEHDAPPASTPYSGTDEEAQRAARLRKPPRVPGAMRTLPPLPLTPSKPPPPLPSRTNMPVPRHPTQMVEMSWVELVDDDLQEDESAPDAALPKLDDGSDGKPEITKVAPSSTQLEGPPEMEGPPEPPRALAAPEPSEPMLDTATVEVVVPSIVPMQHVPTPESMETVPALPPAETVRALDLIVRVTPISMERVVPPEPAPAEESAPESIEVEASEVDAAEANAALNEAEAIEASEAAASVAQADAEALRLEMMAARQREQDARDKEMRQRRKAERERERREQEAKQAAREQEQRDEDARALADIGPKSTPKLDLSNIDDEIDFALDTILGPNLSYPPPAPTPSMAPPKADDDKEKK